MDDIKYKTLYKRGNTIVYAYTYAKHVIRLEDLVIVGNPDTGDISAIPANIFREQFKRIKINERQ